MPKSATHRRMVTKSTSKQGSLVGGVIEARWGVLYAEIYYIQLLAIFLDLPVLLAQHSNKTFEVVDQISVIF